VIQFSKYCDINPSYSATYEEKRFCEFKIPISWFDPPLPCVYIIYQDSIPVYVGKAHHLGERFHSYVNSWKWPSTNIETDHDANINKKILAGAEAGKGYSLWINPNEDESERVVIEKDTIRRYQPAWNIYMYKETRQLDKCECVWSFIKGFNIPLRSFQGRLGDHCTWCKKLRYWRYFGNDFA
tara:strand:+ start:44 stop:592 length:549 start_codon:yes stop_codon:yes gene_type:complete